MDGRNRDGHNGLRKGVACFVLAGGVFLALSGCMSGETSSSSVGSVTASTSTTSTLTGTAQDHTVTFPKLYFELTGTASNPERTLREAGYTDITEGEDGSYTATLLDTDYTAVVNDTYNLVLDLIESIPDDRRYPDATAVDGDEQFATVTVSFSTAEVAPEEILVSDVIGEAVCMYQGIAGLPVGCDVILVGPDGSELANTVFPQASEA